MFRTGILLIIIGILLCMYSNWYVFLLLAGSEWNQFCRIKN